jgi:Ser/Thr protein kinase RdoA (MazF antagonist)
MTGVAESVFAPGEWSEVARAFGIAGRARVTPVGRGASGAAKARVEADGAVLMVKRRPGSDRVVPALGTVHAFQRHVLGAGAPAAGVRATRSGDPVLVRGGFAYEAFEWVHGDRWASTEPEAAAAGTAVGELLAAAAGFRAEGPCPGGTYHRDGAFVGLGRPILEAALRRDPDSDAERLRELVVRIGERGMAAHARADAEGAATSPRQFVHGDLHPGNAVFEDGRVRAFVDFDRMHEGHRACEVASAAFHFSCPVRVGLDPSAWPARVSRTLLRGFLAGLSASRCGPLGDGELRAIPWLMIESCALESLLAVARDGRFAGIRAEPALAHFDRLTAWIESHAADFPG